MSRSCLCKFNEIIFHTFTRKRDQREDLFFHRVLRQAVGFGYFHASAFRQGFQYTGSRKRFSFGRASNPTNFPRSKIPSSCIFEISSPPYGHAFQKVRSLRSGFLICHVINRLHHANARSQLSPILKTIPIKHLHGMLCEEGEKLKPSICFAILPKAMVLLHTFHHISTRLGSAIGYRKLRAD